VISGGGLRSNMIFFLVSLEYSKAHRHVRNSDMKSQSCESIMLIMIRLQSRQFGIFLRIVSRLVCSSRTEAMAPFDGL
jgi:hypothetical protein